MSEIKKMSVVQPPSRPCVKTGQEIFLRCKVYGVSEDDGRVTVMIRKRDGRIEWRYGAHPDDIFVADNVKE